MLKNNLQIIHDVIRCSPSTLLQGSGNTIDYDELFTYSVIMRAVRACCKADGNVLPLFSARRRMPAAALGLKKYLSDTVFCRAADKEDAAPSLWHSGSSVQGTPSHMLAVQSPPSDNTPALP